MYLVKEVGEYIMVKKTKNIWIFVVVIGMIILISQGEKKEASFGYTIQSLKDGWCTSFPDANIYLMSQPVGGKDYCIDTSVSCEDALAGTGITLTWVDNCAGDCAGHYESCETTGCCVGYSCEEDILGDMICIEDNYDLYSFCTDCSIESCTSENGVECISIVMGVVQPSSPTPCDFHFKTIHPSSDFYTSYSEAESASGPYCGGPSCAGHGDSCSVLECCSGYFCATPDDICVEDGANRFWSYCTDLLCEACWTEDMLYCVASAPPLQAAYQPTSPDPCFLVGKTIHVDSQFYDNLAECQYAVGSCFNIGESCLSDNQCCANSTCYNDVCTLCQYGDWVAGDCDAGSCTSNERQYTRTRTPDDAGCEGTTKCEADASCQGINCGQVCNAWSAWSNSTHSCGTRTRDCGTYSDQCDEDESKTCPVEGFCTSDDDCLAILETCENGTCKFSSWIYIMGGFLVFMMAMKMMMGASKR